MIEPIIQNKKYSILKHKLFLPISFSFYYRQQIQTLRENNNNNFDNMPLVQARDVMQYMPQLAYMVRAQQQDQPTNKRQRMS